MARETVETVIRKKPPCCKGGPFLALSFPSFSLAILVAHVNSWTPTCVTGGGPSCPLPWPRFDSRLSRSVTRIVAWSAGLPRAMGSCHVFHASRLRPAAGPVAPCPGLGSSRVCGAREGFM